MQLVVTSNHSDITALVVTEHIVREPFQGYGQVTSDTFAIGHVPEVRAQRRHSPEKRC